MIKAIKVLFSTLHTTLHTTSFLHEKIYLAVLHQHNADGTRSDTTWGSKLPYLQVEAFKSLQIQCVHRGVLSLLNCPVCFILLYLLRRYSCANLIPVDLHATCIPFICGHIFCVQ